MWRDCASLMDARETPLVETCACTNGRKTFPEKNTLSSHYVTSMSIKRDDAMSALTQEHEIKSGLEDEEKKLKRKEESL